MQTKLQFFIKAAPLLLVLFIDSMGLGIVIPVVNGLFFDPHSHFLSGSFNTPSMHNAIYGAVIAIFMFCWFFGASFLGDLSDKIGRKKSLAICLFGAAISYLLSALAVTFQSVTMLLIGRVIAGLTAGSQPIAQAAIVDMSPPEVKTRNMSYMFLILSLGFILGPLLGGVLADKQIFSMFNFAVPFYFAAVISLLNLLMLYFFFQETYQSNGRFAFHLHRAFHILVAAFEHDKVRKVVIIYLLFIFGWSSFYSFISEFLMRVYGFTPTGVSIYMAVMGLGFGIGNGLVMGWLLKRMTVISIVINMSLVGASAALVIAAVPSMAIGWVAMLVLSISVSVSSASIYTLFSNQVGTDQQGWVMGVTGSVMALDWAINGVIIGVLTSLGAHLPLYVSAISLVLASIAMICYQHKINLGPNSAGPTVH